MSSYFIISNSDGDTTVDKISKEELLRRLNESYYGNVEYKNQVEESDTNYWGEGVLIIKGEIVVPEPIETVKEYDID